jgi:hypothetical protein
MSLERVIGLANLQISTIYAFRLMFDHTYTVYALLWDANFKLAATELFPVELAYCPPDDVKSPHTRSYVARNTRLYSSVIVVDVAFLLLCKYGANVIV